MNRTEYMHEYRLQHPEKWKRTPEQQVKINARRRELYALDESRREAARMQAREWQRANPTRRKGQRLKRYGLTVEQFDQLLSKQDGQCAICGFADQMVPNLFPLVDHCHETGQVRGLLCMNCNQGIGKFQNDPERLRAAAAYLMSSG